METVFKGSLYTLPTGVRIRAACDGLVVDGRLVPAERMAAALNALGGYGKVKRRTEGNTSELTQSGPDSRG